MQSVLRFNLSGSNAFFKKPDVNKKIYFTYNNIHKIALLGMIGAIIGLEGWKAREKNNKSVLLPEFYERLKAISVSIVPLSEKGYFPKKIQYFNNSVGYASKEEGGNLQVFEQWLENPSWDIYLKNDSANDEDWQKICEYILNDKCVYIPYLGKNDFFAVISNAYIRKLDTVQAEFCDSVCISDYEMIDGETTFNDRKAFLFSEFIPTALNKDIGYDSFKRSFFTNCRIENLGDMLYDPETKRSLYFI